MIVCGVDGGGRGGGGGGGGGPDPRPPLDPRMICARIKLILYTLHVDYNESTIVFCSHEVKIYKNKQQKGREVDPCPPLVRT